MSSRFDIENISSNGYSTATSAGPLYVCSPYDESPFGGLLLSELRSAYAKHHIPHRDAYVFECIHVWGLSLRQVAKAMQLSHVRIYQIAKRVYEILAGDKELGIVTAVFESLGGWPAVREYYAGLNTRGRKLPN